MSKLTQRVQRVSHVDTERMTPAQSGELYGGFVLPNRLVIPIVRGNQLKEYLPLI